MADSKRKTANLFSGYTIGIGINATTGAQENDNQAATSDYIDIDSTKTYTVSGLDGNLRSFINVYNADKQSLGRTAATERTSLTFDSTSFTGGTPQGTGDIKYIRIKQYKALTTQPDITDINNYNIMLNTGSQPLPYEPYGWLHSLRKLTTATDTLTTLPADLYANGNNATVGLVGNMSQSGTPSPTTPIQPSETGERTANLFDMAWYENKTGITVTENKATGTCDSFVRVKISIPSELYGLQLTWSVYLKRPDKASTVRVQTADDGVYNIGNEIIGEGLSTVTFTATSTIRLYINFGSTGEDTIEVSNIMLNTGSTAKPYEPYGYKIPILNNSQTTNVYLGEVQTTRKVKKYEFTGQENITLYGASITRVGFYFNRNDAILNGRTTGICSHFKPQATTSGSTIDGVTFGANDKNFYFTFSADSVSTYNLTDITSIKAYLTAQYSAGTPVTVWYVLANETTGIVNEPLRKIGDYADTVSGITIPTITGKDSFDVLTILKPSEVELTYTGWHDAQCKESDGSDWQ